MEFPKGGDIKPPEESLSSSGGFFIGGMNSFIQAV
jgi:hypothetical protein